jgi:hypothetical protein
MNPKTASKNPPVSFERQLVPATGKTAPLAPASSKPAKDAAPSLRTAPPSSFASAAVTFAPEAPLAVQVADPSTTRMQVQASSTARADDLAPVLEEAQPRLEAAAARAEAERAAAEEAERAAAEEASRQAAIERARAEARAEMVQEPGVVVSSTNRSSRDSTEQEMDARADRIGASVERSNKKASNQAQPASDGGVVLLALAAKLLGIF